MPKLFVVSDIHSFFTIFHDELNKKGFEENNPDHLLVICGDCFDRGRETIELLEYLNKVSNKVIVKGNHEFLIEEVWKRGGCRGHDLNNGTMTTIQDIFYKYSNIEPYEPIRVSEKILKPFIDKMIPYFETKNYVFVHGWIPMKYDTSKPFAEYGDPTLFDENWRNGDWEQAAWLNGIKQANRGIIIPDKTIVCGHWHCSYGWHLKSIKTDHWISQFDDNAKWEPYVDTGIIAIDRCTAHTGEVNVLVLEDEFIEKTLDKLKNI